MIPTGRLARLLQTCLLAPAVVIGASLLWLVWPLWLIVGAIAAQFVPSFLRPVRILWLLVLHLSLEAIALVEMFGLWIASGFGLLLKRPFFEQIHYTMADLYLRIMFREARRVLRLKIETVGVAPDAYPGTPLLVFSRHAGAGDSFVLLHALMHWYDRQPRVVLKETLAWDPAVGILFRRLPSRLVSADPQSKQVGPLAAHLDEDDAFVMFPEGGNFTAKRKRSGVEWLRRQGRHDLADQASAMTHVLAPRTKGVSAALDAAPGVDVLMVAHTGLDHINTLSDAWRAIPMNKVLKMGWWRIPRAEIPDGEDDRTEWLYRWWRTIDEWVDHNRPVDYAGRRPDRAKRRGAN